MSKSTSSSRTGPHLSRPASLCLACSWCSMPWVTSGPGDRRGDRTEDLDHPFHKLGRHPQLSATRGPSQRMLSEKEDLSQMLCPHMTLSSTPPWWPQEEAEVLSS